MRLHTIINKRILKSNKMTINQLARWYHHFILPCFATGSAGISHWRRGERREQGGEGGGRGGGGGSWKEGEERREVRRRQLQLTPSNEENEKEGSTLSFEHRMGSNTRTRLSQNTQEKAAVKK